MKHALLVCIIILPMHSMETFQETVPLEQEIRELIDTLEEQASFPHPHATARIEIIRQKLVTCYWPSVCTYWQKSRVLANAHVMVANTHISVQKHQNSSLYEPAKLLQNNALHILGAIKKLDEQIQNMPSCASGTHMVASTKNGE